MTGNEMGLDIRRSVSSRARVHRPRLTVLVVLAATVLPPTVYLVASGAHPGRIRLGVAGAERVQVTGEESQVLPRLVPRVTSRRAWHA